MTARLSAMNGLYGMNNFQNYYNNPYFLQAFNSPNYNQYMQAQQGNVQQNFNNVAQTTGQNGTQLPNGANVNFQGAQNAIANQGKEEKSGNGLAWALGITATAIGTAWWLASRGKARNAKGLWNQIKLGATSLFNKPKVLRGAKIADYKDSLKINEALKWTDEAANLKGFQFELKNPDGVLNRITVRDGQLVGLTDLTQKATKENNLRNITEAYKNSKLNEGFQKQIDEIIKMVTSKDVSKLPTGVEIKNIVYTNPVENGIVSYMANAAKAERNGLRHLRVYPN